MPGGSKTGHSSSRSSVDGLITPDSSGAVSPNIKLEDLVAIRATLTRIVNTDLRKSTIQARFPELSWADIQTALERVQLPSHFTAPELRLIVKEWYSSGDLDLQLLEDECFHRTREEIHSRLISLELTYGVKRETLQADEIAAMEICHDNKLHVYDEIRPLLPGYSKTDVRQLIVENFPHKVRWSPGEISYVEKQLKAGLTAEDFALNLPFRRLCEVRQKANALAKKFNIVTASSRALQRAKYNAELDRIIENDMTSTGVENAGLDVSKEQLIKDIKAKLKENGGSSEFAFTKPENEILRQTVNDSMSREDCEAELIFRTPEEIERKIKKFESVYKRRKKFTSGVDRLIYEAQWYSSMAEDSARGGRRRSSRRDVQLDELMEEAAKQHEVKEEPTAADFRKRRRRTVTRENSKDKQKRRTTRASSATPKEESVTPAPTRRITRSKNKKKLQRVDSLVEEARWFQSVTGDGSYVEEGTKRKRQPTTIQITPELKNRRQLKKIKKELAQKREVEVVKKRGRGRPRLHPILVDEEESEETEEPEAESIEMLEQALEEKDSSEEEEESSPYDPTGITDDTLVQFEDRQLFNENIATSFLFPAPIKFSPDVSVFLEDTDEIPINNILAAKLIRENSKRYNSLPDSFPPLFVEDSSKKTIVNPRNIVHLRYLLYPHHTEQFILAEPKGNELDPVDQIKKLFEIHYALYFSFSEEVKEIVQNDFCDKLTKSVEDNDFLAFMKIIDRWNALMLELTPYPIEIQPAIDINASSRDYLPRTYDPLAHNIRDLRLQTFYMEVINAADEVKDSKYPVRRYAMQRRPSMNLKSPLRPNPQHAPHLTSTPEVFVSRYRHLRPMSYSVAFMDLLSRKVNISRYCVHQLILRPYVRIVSPESRKLRSYKAFSAEVYGELLPSFISEVLTKVGITPGQKFYDLGCGVANTTLQAALEFGVQHSGGCELMEHASNLARLQEIFMQKQLKVFGLKPMNLSLALHQSFVDNEAVRKECLDCDVILVNNYLFEFPLNVAVGKLLYGLKPGSKIISLRNFITPRYKAGGEDTIFDYLKVEKFEMSDFFSVSWTANKVPYYISVVQEDVVHEYERSSSCESHSDSLKAESD